jgi:hypothetical protein
MMHGTSIFEIKNHKPAAHAKNPIILKSDLYFIYVTSYYEIEESSERSLLPFD